MFPIVNFYVYIIRWTFVLSNLDHEMGKRLEQIRKEMERTTNAAHLDLVEKSEIIAEKSQLITSTVSLLLIFYYGFYRFTESYRTFMIVHVYRSQLH